MHRGVGEPEGRGLVPLVPAARGPQVFPIQPDDVMKRIGHVGVTVDNAVVPGCCPGPQVALD